MSEVHSDPYDDPTSPIHFELRLVERLVPSSAGGVDDNRSSHEILAPPAWRAGIRTLAIVPESTDAWNCGKSIAHQLIADLPNLHTVSFVANDQPGIVDEILEFRAVCAARQVPLVVAFALARDADGCAVLAGKPASLQGIWSLSRQLRAEHVPVRWWIPLTSELVFRLDSIVSLAAGEQIEPLFSFDGAQVEMGTLPRLELDRDAQMFAWDFVTYRLLEQDRSRWSAAMHDHWRQVQGVLVSAVEDADRSSAVSLVSCVHLATDGERFHQSTVQRPRSSTPGAVRWTAAAPHRSLQNLSAQLADIAGVFWDGAHAVGQSIRTRFSRFARPPIDLAPRMMPTMMAIGAYGGDHIGDAAILGGVLLRIHHRYGTIKAVLMSQRPNHSRRLVAMLDLPVQVDVAPYTHRAIRAALPRVDGVVFAGGPLIDLPKQLVRHLYAVSLAVRQGKHFVMEGIGPGPFVRFPSQWVARRLLNLASRITVRTSLDLQQPVVRGHQLEIERDPAFDYLETRPRQLNRMPPEDERFIEHLLADTTGRPVIGVNLRPIHAQYSSVPPGIDRRTYTQQTQDRFIEQFADGLRAFHEKCRPAPCFIFFPMNAIQFGSSDLRSAYRIQRLLSEEIDFRVWQGDATLDGVLQLLRRVDVAITMRFHATIFALSQGKPVIGIDYRIGKLDKVGALLGDAGHSENCCRIDELTSDWLVGRLQETISRRPATEAHRPDFPSTFHSTK